MTPWFERKFAPITDKGRLPTIIERLDGTEFRLVGKLADDGDINLSKKIDGKWSIKEEIGHLLTLEKLWTGRVRDIAAGKEFLRGADLTNEATDKGNFNQRDLDELLDEFGEKREVLLNLLRNFKSEDLDKSSKHPRLLTPMTVLDLAYFVAEHDDHHLLRISNIISKQFNG